MIEEIKKEFLRMKTINKYGGKNVLNLVILLLLVLSSCGNDNRNDCKYPHESSTLSTHQIPMSLQSYNNYEEVGGYFTLQDSAKIHIQCVTEVVLVKRLPKVYNDGIELFFDINNEKTKKYNPLVDKKFFVSDTCIDLIKDLPAPAEILYSFSQNTNKDGYVIEVGIPWSVLGINPMINNNIGFDCSVIDHDDGDILKNKKIAWHSTDSDIFMDKSLYGDLVFSSKKKANNENSIHSTFIEVNQLKIDGKIDEVWNKVQPYVISNSILGEKKANEAACIKTIWDNRKLYLLFVVNDEKIVLSDNLVKVCDYGSIEDTSGNVIWSPSFTSGTFFNSKNKIVDTSINLKKGRYLLKYKSDESHSPNSWLLNSKIPDFYGINLQLVPKKRF